MIWCAITKNYDSHRKKILMVPGKTVFCILDPIYGDGKLFELMFCRPDRIKSLFKIGCSLNFKLKFLIELEKIWAENALLKWCQVRWRSPLRSLWDHKIFPIEVISTKLIRSYWVVIRSYCRAERLSKVKTVEVLVYNLNPSIKTFQTHLNDRVYLPEPKYVRTSETCRAIFGYFPT